MKRANTPTPSTRDREERARKRQLVSASNPPCGGDYFRMKGDTFEVLRTFPTMVKARRLDLDSEVNLTLRDLEQGGAYYVERPKQTFTIDVTMFRADPNATTDGYHIKIPGFEAKWHGDKDIARDIWAYIWKTHGAKLICHMSPDEMLLFSQKLKECGVELEQHPELQRAAVSLTGVREQEASA